MKASWSAQFAGPREDKAYIEWFGRLERAVASPSAIVALMRANYDIDVSDLLPSIRVPTLILHREGDALVPVEAGRYWLATFPGAKYVELPGDDHMLQAMDQDVLDILLDQIEEFITGRRPSPGPDQIFATAAHPPIWSAPQEHIPLAPAARMRSPDDASRSSNDAGRFSLPARTGAGLAGLVARAEAVVAAARGSWSESEAQFIKAAETFRRHGMVWQEAKTFQSWGDALRAGADRRAAIEKLDMAIEIYRRHARARSGSAAPKASLARTNVTVVHPVHNTESTAPASSRAMFRREGDYWTCHGGATWSASRMPRAFTTSPTCWPIPAARSWPANSPRPGPLPANEASSDPGGTAADLGDAGALLDAKAREQYRRRMAELREELAEAVQLNDTGRAARLRSELESLRNQIVAAVGLGGRDRKAASHTERARLMVTKAIKAAIAKVRASDAALGRYLATSIKTGNCCTYDPGARASRLLAAVELLGAKADSDRCPDLCRTSARRACIRHASASGTIPLQTGTVQDEFSPVDSRPERVSCSHR